MQALLADLKEPESIQFKGLEMKLMRWFIFFRGISFHAPDWHILKALLDDYCSKFLKEMESVEEDIAKLEKALDSDPAGKRIDAREAIDVVGRAALHDVGRYVDGQFVSHSSQIGLQRCRLLGRRRMSNDTVKPNL